jgi:hypothetical protein
MATRREDSPYGFFAADLESYSSIERTRHLGYMAQYDNMYSYGSCNSSTTEEAVLAASVCHGAKQIV